MQRSVSSWGIWCLLGTLWKCKEFQRSRTHTQSYIFKRAENLSFLLDRVIHRAQQPTIERIIVRCLHKFVVARRRRAAAHNAFLSFPSARAISRFVLNCLHSQIAPLRHEAGVYFRCLLLCIYGKLENAAPAVFVLRARLLLLGAVFESRAY